MNERVLEKLEFNRIREMLAAQACSAGGRDLALNLVPLAERKIIEKSFDELEEAMGLLRVNEPSFLYKIREVKLLLRKAAIGGMLQPPELLDISLVLQASRRGGSYLARQSGMALETYQEALVPLPLLEKDIAAAVDDEGRLRDDASDVLKKLRRDIESLRQRIKAYMQDFVRSGSNQSYLQEALVTERSGRYVVPVKVEHRAIVKGIVHDESASGATVFIEPMAAVEMNNKIRSLQIEEQREVERILRRLSAMAAVYQDEICLNYDTLVALDLVFARASLAFNLQAFRPQVREDGVVDLIKARHPLLGDRAVPINVELGQNFDILVITGPNTGGKTVVLKTIGLCCLMAMAGLYIPANENSVVSIFSPVFVDIGDEQSLEQSLSTFSSHMSNIINILENAGAKSLVLLDELGAGTDPVEGSALARAIMVRLLEIGARAVVTTHQGELKNFAYQSERVENACVEFNPFTFQPTYALTIGTPGQSNAFEIARRLGLDDSIVDSARSFVPDRERETSLMIRRLKESQHSYDEMLGVLESRERDFAREQSRFNEEKGRFEGEQKKIISQSRREASDYLRRIKRQADDALEEFKKSLKAEDDKIKWHQIEEGRRSLKALEERPANESGAIYTDELALGDHVSIAGIKQKGQIIAFPSPEEVEVQVGGMKIRARREQLNLIAAEKERAVRQYQRLVSERLKDLSVEIDLRGKSAEEALYELESYLDNAVLCGLKRVRIIHGKGTGALRKAVREYLKGHRAVLSFQDSAYNEGGSGATTVEFN